METEVKLAFDSPDRLWEILDSDWFMNFCLDNEPKEPVTLVNTYYDTADRKLSSRGGMIRIRLYKSGDNEDSYEHTVKYGGKVDNGLHQRYEWNVKADSKNFDVAEFKRNAYNEDDPNELLDEILEVVVACSCPVCLGVAPVLSAVIYKASPDDDSAVGLYHITEHVGTVRLGSSVGEGAGSSL